MFVIGLTGGIASGKSTVSNMLRRLGAPVIDADVIAREVVAPGQPAWRDIVGYFGPAVLQADQTLDRHKLGEIVFDDTRARQVLEQFTHPRIWARMQRQLHVLAAAGCAVAVLDVPLLIETGWHKMVDQVWLVYVEPAVQLARLMTRDGLSRAAAQARIAAQLPWSVKKACAHIIIDNGRDLADTQRQVKQAWAQVKQRTAKQTSE